MQFLLTILGIYSLTLSPAHLALAWASAEPSQTRPKDVPWEKMAEAYGASVQVQSGELDSNVSAPSLSAYDARVRYSKLPLEEIPEWNGSPDGAELQKEFERVRDLRFLALPEMKSFLRRIPWLYPDDGCYVRAELATEEIAKGELSHGGYPVPKKLFVFGDLALKTENSPEGWVYWWYHVAPVVYIKQPAQTVQATQRSEENVYVLDPSMNPKHPIRLKIWVESMIGQTRLAKVSLCDAISYGPSSICHPKDTTAGPNVAQKANEDVQRFLRNEWFRIKGLGRDPRKELSDQPPW